jgi:hypothetical protein
MAPPIVIAISIMWIPVALFFLGWGEPKGTGFAAGITGLLTVIGAILEAAVFKGPFLAGLLFVHGLFYLSVCYALMAGLQDLRSVGNVALTTCIVSFIYMVLFWTGGPVLEAGKRLVAPSSYLTLACAGYGLLTLMVFLNAYGKFSGKVLAYSLIVWVVVGLWVPGFWLMSAGRLPF